MYGDGSSQIIAQRESHDGNKNDLNDFKIYYFGGGKRDLYIYIYGKSMTEKRSTLEVLKQAL